MIKPFDVLVVQKSVRMCEHELMTSESRNWRVRHERSPDMKCRNTAKYIIGGRHFCGRHAGSVAIDVLMKLQAELDKRNV